MFDKVNQIIQEKVRPHLQEHQGDIELISVKDGIVRIKFLGACSGCPSADTTVEEVVKVILKQEIPKIEDVILIHGVDEELLDMARAILNRKKK